MDVVKFGEKYKSDLVICMGNFDGLHKGHTALLTCEKTKKYIEQGNSLALFTFDDNFSKYVKNSERLFTYEERLSLYKKFGVNLVIVAPSTKEFLLSEPDDFLIDLFSIYKIDLFVCGDDYRYGKNATGDISHLLPFLKSGKIDYQVVDGVYLQGKRISSSLIKEKLKQGNIIQANAMLGFQYFISGEVINGKKIGRKIGFPTINIQVSSNKVKLKSGVYKTKVEIDGVSYRAITNYGNAPTFLRDEFIVETHIIGFDGDLYGKTLKVEFVDYLRPIIKFNNEQELIRQIKKDIEL